MQMSPTCCGSNPSRGIKRPEDGSNEHDVYILLSLNDFTKKPDKLVQDHHIIQSCQLLITLLYLIVRTSFASQHQQWVYSD